jgi:hypothetical protein
MRRGPQLIELDNVLGQFCALLSLTKGKKVSFCVESAY